MSSTHSPSPTTPAGNQPYELQLDLREHNIVFTLPPGSELSGVVRIPGGALIFGTLRGRLICDSGSAVICKGAVFEGELEADQVYVDGQVKVMSKATARLLQEEGATTDNAPALQRFFGAAPVAGAMSRLLGRHYVAVSADAFGKADAASKSFAVHGKMFAARYIALRD